MALSDKVASSVSFHGLMESQAYQKYRTNLKIEEQRKLTYFFSNHFHPYTGEMIEQLNKQSLLGLFDVDFQKKIELDFFKQYNPNNITSGNEQVIVTTHHPHDDKHPYPPKNIDLSEDGPYSIYNWELLFHAPLTVANHLFKQQRYDEAEKYLKLIFDPTTNEPIGTNDPKIRYWRFRAFREAALNPIKNLLEELSNPNDSEIKTSTLKSIEAWRNKPFQPHVVARSRFMAYQHKTVMLWMDIYLARGDGFFRQFTPETLDMALLNYVQVTNLLGPRPQQIPRNGKKKPVTFASIKKNLDSFGNTMIDLEAEFPLNLNFPATSGVNTNESSSLFGVSHTLYFCIPANEKLLKYWDTVDDRLFKIRHCMNIEGVVQPLPLFDPFIDPGMLVKAVAAGLDIGSIISGLNQPLFIVRSPFLIQKALEICNELKSLGSALLSAIEKKEGESLAVLRQSHELKLLQLTQDVKYIQWKDAETSTDSLLKSHHAAFLRFNHYQLLLGQSQSEINKYKDITFDRNTTPITKDSFDQYYQKLIGKYTINIREESYRQEQAGFIDNAANAAQKAIASIPIIGDMMPNDGANLGLSKRENVDLNVYMPVAHLLTQGSSVLDVLSAATAVIPQFDAHGTPLGVGAAVSFGGTQISTAASIGAKLIRLAADEFNYMGARATKLAGYQRRTEDWVLQSNLAANELAQVGRQVLSSLIREQITRKEYENHQVQVENTLAIQEFYQNKFTQQELYQWMQNEIAKVYFDTYKFAFDVARRAELTMRSELRRPELDQQDFIKFGYWDSTRKGLLAGENLYLDIRRMDLAYHDNNKREYEITKHISLVQLNPFALLLLKTTGTCTIEIPEWLFDMDCPGQYMRRIKTVSISIPCIAGPYTSVNCTLALNKSSIRVSPLLNGDDYKRNVENDDNRFLDFFGSAQTIVTSNAQNDSGLFETNLRDERYLPFESSGVISSWSLSLPNDVRQFDYNTISDVVFHIRYTAREAGILREKAQENITTMIAEEEILTRIFSLIHDFPNEFYQIGDSNQMKVIIKKEHFPYLAQSRAIAISNIVLCHEEDGILKRKNLTNLDFWDDINKLEKNNQFELSILEDFIKAKDWFLQVNYCLR